MRGTARAAAVACVAAVAMVAASVPIGRSGAVPTAARSVGALPPAVKVPKAPRAANPGAAALGYVDPVRLDARIDGFLAYSTEWYSPSSALSMIAHLERARRDPSFSYDASAVRAADFAADFARIDGFVDTTDFTMLYLTNLWQGYRDELAPDLRAAIEQRFRTFKHWWTEPTPPGVVDNKYYWSENHQIIFHTVEYLAGAAFPGDVFTNDGRLGAAHRDDARQRILDWIDQKVRFGFTEWHSDVYYQKNVTPLLTLVEFAPDRVVRRRAAMLLDLVLLDIALHIRDGNFGVTHGRSYQKDKTRATDQDTFGLTKLLFGGTSAPYVSRDDAGAVLLSRAQRYRLPKAIARIARTERTFVDREHMGVPLDPSAPVVADPPAPYGYDFDDPDNVTFWWERGAQTAWQEVASTIAALTLHDLWDSQFFRPFKPLRDLVGDDMDLARTLAQSLAPQLAFALLSEVDTYTYRSPSVMLSTAQDYRPGAHSEQHHVWQATLDANAVVYTTHPKNEPLPNERWPDEDGYFTGNGSLPRSAQYRTVNITMYAPQFVPSPFLPGGLGYIDKTHAFFPREMFDEVRTVDGWTVGRKGNGYVGIWSWRPTEWRSWDPTVYFNRGLTQPYDLVADGGADNVWITQVGDRATSGGFGAFVRSLRDARIEVSLRPEVGGLPGGFDVVFASPVEGRLTFGWSAPLTRDGRPVPLHRTQRYDNPFVRAEFGASRYRIHTGDAHLTLDFDRNQRRAFIAGS